MGGVSLTPPSTPGIGQESNSIAVESGAQSKTFYFCTQTLFPQKMALALLHLMVLFFALGVPIFFCKFQRLKVVVFSLLAGLLL